MPRFLFNLISACLICLLLLPVFAAAATESNNSGITFVIDGTLYTSPAEEPAPYINADHRTMVPVSFFARAMGVPDSSIRWDNAAKTASIQGADQHIQITLGSDQLQVNAEKVQMDTQAEVVKGRVFIPVRFITEALDGQIGWDPYNKVIVITSSAHVMETPSAAEAEALIETSASAVLDALHDKDMEALASLVHPVQGIRFSPYSYIDVLHHVKLGPAELNSALTSNQALVWGYYDGTGEAIELTFTNYYDQFIYPYDYRSADSISYQTQQFSGNAINNAETVYPGSIIVEYHFEGFDPQFAGMDWRSLRLVFQIYNGQWYLTGLINDQWTI